MDKAVLKKFAIESRQDLMQRMENKIKTFYIDEEFSKQQSGDVYNLANSKHSLNLSKEEYTKRELLIKRINELGLDQVIEEAAYTWFNRIVAIRYMEIHDYLPLTRDNQSLGIRVLSSKDNTPDPEIMKFTNLVNPELDIDFKKEKYVELKDDNEKFKYILLLVCRKLGRVIPQVFDGVTDYIDILTPDNLLNEAGFVNKIITEVPEENYKQVEIIGWLYQYYISEKKDEVFKEIKNKKKIKKEDIPVATQLFTPNWIVKYLVENSIINYLNNKELENKLGAEYLIQDNSNFSENNEVENIKIIDPCSGSGHILVYAFEILFKLYEQKGYEKSSIAERILNNNLYALDLDERAIQLTTLSILLKARLYDKNIFNKPVNLNFLSITDSNHINKEDLNLLTTKINDDNNEKIINDINYIYDIFLQAKELGSIIKCESRDYDLILDRIKKLEKENLNIIELSMLYTIKKYFLPLVKQAKILSEKYDIFLTNPPYMGQTCFNNYLKKYLEKEYNNGKMDMFAVFMYVAINMTKSNGYIGMITMQSWMFLSSYAALREDLYKNVKISSMVHLGAGTFEELNAFNVLSTTFILKKEALSDSEGTYVRLVDYTNHKEKEKQFFNKENYFKAKLSKYKNLPNKSLLYWINEQTKNIFENEKTLAEFTDYKQGMATADNKRFVREWYEVNFEKIGFNISSLEEAQESKKKWFPYSKSGDYRKWYGNNLNIVNWENDGLELKEYTSKLPQGSAVRLKSKEFYFKKGITCSLFGFENFGVRYREKGYIFDVSTTSFFNNDENELKYIIGFLTTNVAYYLLNLIAPTVNFSLNYVSKLPLIMNKDNMYYNVIKLAEANIDISKEEWNDYENSWNFKKHPILNFESNNLETAYNKWFEKASNRITNLTKNEEAINKIFIDMYYLNDTVDFKVREKDISLRKPEKLKDIKSFISYAVGCMFGRYSLDKDGLILAGGTFDENNYITFKADNDNIIPITDEAYFSDDIVERFKTFIKTIYGDNTFNENMDFIAEALGQKGTETSEETIRRYFVNDFFNDHCKIYQKKPIYWLLDSGKKNGFKALIYMHRYNENLIPKARLDYLHRIQTTYEKLLSDVNYKLTTDLSMVDKKDAQKRQVDLNAKLQEIKEYDEKIAHIANQRITIDLDDGVKINYEKFKDILAKIK